MALFPILHLIEMLPQDRSMLDILQQRVNENFLGLFSFNRTPERCNCDVNLSKDGKL